MARLGALVWSARNGWLGLASAVSVRKKFPGAVVRGWGFGAEHRN